MNQWLGYRVHPPYQGSLDREIRKSYEYIYIIYNIYTYYIIYIYYLILYIIIYIYIYGKYGEMMITNGFCGYIISRQNQNSGDFPLECLESWKHEVKSFAWRPETDQRELWSWLIDLFNDFFCCFPKPADSNSTKDDWVCICRGHCNEDPFPFKNPKQISKKWRSPYFEPRLLEPTSEDP